MRKRYIWFAGGVAALLVNAASVKASEDPLFLPQYDLSIRQAGNPAKPGNPPAYAATRPKATWSIIAWNIPDGQLPPFSESRGAEGSVFSSHTPSASVVIKQKANSGSELELSQDGRVLPCNTANGHPAEFDLFLHPNDKADAYEQVGYTAAPEFKQGLDALSTLKVKTRLSFRAGDADRSEECGVASSNVTAGFILGNPSAKQTLFYDIVLATACGKQPQKRLDHCKSFLSHPWLSYFSRKTPFGVDDPAPLLGEPFVRNGEARDIDLDVLPGLLAAIERAPDGMDRDPAHWRLTGFLDGQVIYGGMKVATTWSNLTVAAARK